MPRIEIDGGENLTPKQQKLVARKLKPILAICKMMRKSKSSNAMGNIAQMNTIMQQHQEEEKKLEQKAKQDRKDKKERKKTKSHKRRK